VTKVNSQGFDLDDLNSPLVEPSHMKIYHNLDFFADDCRVFADS